MSLAEAPTNGHTPNGHSLPTVEYSEAVEAQKRVDAELEAVHFTGVTMDAVTGDWCCWQHGRIIGWAKTPGEAGQRVNACAAAQAAHPQPATISTARDDNPCSIELQRAKDGVPYWTLKTYHAAGEETAAVARLAELDEKLIAQYRPELTPAS